MKFVSFQPLPSSRVTSVGPKVSGGMGIKQTHLVNLAIANARSASPPLSRRRESEGRRPDGPAGGGRREGRASCSGEGRNAAAKRG